MNEPQALRIPVPVDAAAEADYSAGSDEFDALSRDRIPVRSMAEGDLEAIVRIDAKITGRDDWLMRSNTWEIRE